MPVLLHWTPAKGLLVPLSKLPTNDSRPAIAATNGGRVAAARNDGERRRQKNDRRCCEADSHEVAGGVTGAGGDGVGVQWRVKNENSRLDWESCETRPAGFEPATFRSGGASDDRT